MTIMTVRIPEDVKAAFDKVFEGEDKDAHLAGAVHKRLHRLDVAPQIAHIHIRAFLKLGHGGRLHAQHARKLAAMQR
jgi:hypothetical protein